VLCVLFNSGEWMIPVNQENLVRSSAASTPVSEAVTPSHQEDADRPEESAMEGKPEPVAAVEVKGDPEIAPVYLRHLLPVFTNVFQAAMLLSVR
jgi:hypothetical protein